MGRVEWVSFRLWAALAVIMVVVERVDSIRVYEGTNFPGPIPKSSKSEGLSKKSLYITKRSWNSAEEKLLKAEAKWKDVNKKVGVEGAPTLYKIKFNDKNFMQYLRYIKEIPRMEEYTFCLWYKSENLCHDQTLFSYSLNKDEILLRFWISALDSTLRMSIREHTALKVPTNIRVRKWYHICQSWNGVLGEWQVFLDGKRIGAGVLSRYKGTYIPEGGEITLGQELIGLNKRPSDGMDGELFGFNLVDEAVPQDQGIFINSQYRPNQRVPPFKKLPPIKKTYQEIKAYISSLPNDPSETLKKNEAFPGQTPNTIKKPKDTYSSPSKRTRGNQRLRYPPLRKVVVYNRDDRQLYLDEAEIELKKTKPAIQSLNQTGEPKKEVKSQDVNYSIHSYRFVTDEKQPKNYEIYEVAEDDGGVPVSEDELTKEQSLERKARQNFNLFTAREANKVYTLSSSVKEAKKPVFHFETRTETPEGSNKKSFVAKESGRAPEIGTKRTASDLIPVHEPEIALERKRRSADKAVQSKQPKTVADDPFFDSNGFRRLPQIPESFINIFTQNASRLEIEKKLDQFFPQNSTQETNVVAAITEVPVTSPVTTEVATVRSEQISTETPMPPFSPVPPQVFNWESLSEMELLGALRNPGPVNFPIDRKISPRPSGEENGVPHPQMRYANSIRLPEAAMERKRFDVSAGTDLVMRSYGECTVERGSPVRDKQHLVISWADTPVRIFGGAQVEGARNQCGYF